VMKDYPEWQDEAFISANLERWLAP